MYLLGVLFMALGVAASIALHEIGHLVPAKKFGVKVTQYMVGFGPTVWSRRRGETEYGVKAIPLGGYIRMIGMFPPKPGSDPSFLRDTNTGRFSQLMDQARSDSMLEVTPGDEDRVFYKLPVHQKLVIMLGGPTMNLAIAVVLLAAVFTLYGIPQSTTKVGTVSQCVQTAVSTATGTPATCAPTDPVTPANQAGIRPGDRIVSVAGTPVTEWQAVRTLVRENGGKPVVFVVERDGENVTLQATPILTQVPQLAEDGTVKTGPDGAMLTQEAGFMGFSPAAEIVPQPVTAVPGLIWSQLANTAGVVVRIPEKMVGVVQAAFGTGARDPNGPISIVGVGRVAGEVANGDVQLLGGDGFVSTFMTLLSLIAALNLALFLFNLIPLLPLDGGHAAGALWEGLRRWWARVLGKPDPGYVDVAKALPVAYAMSIALIVMSALLIYADVVKPIQLG